MQNGDGLGMSIPRLKQKLGISDAETQFGSQIIFLQQQVTELQDQVQILEKAQPYSFSIYIGTIGGTGGAVESFVSQNNVISTITYTAHSSTESKYQVDLDITKLAHFTQSDNIIVFLQPRSYRGSASTIDNDLWVPIVSIPQATTSLGFWFFLERTGTATSHQLCIDGIIMKRGTTIPF